ncbi:2-methylcitrate synthase [Helicobacter aurati]|uniref:Citrate synthase n=1 Tax=Helicobacter aurati TaxID=137778 RepID=A0A3D8J593_9HELI|nr:citrate/2-methylcitrate synthase [Helicobacter aurati]RDU72410.1 2-methylcitrate synthase [Helicobacter aurati]
MSSKKKQGGLAGIVAGKTAICTVGDGHSLRYCGYDIYELAEKASFEEVAYLLLYGELPKSEELESFTHALFSNRILPKEVREILKLIPKDSHPMDVMRTGISALGNFYPEKEDRSNQDSIALQILGASPSILLYWHAYHHNIELNLESKDSVLQDNTAKFFLETLHQKQVPQLWIDAMNVSLILYAEHEFNASTFTSRTIASTLSDLHSSIIGGICALKGPLHGGANEAAMELLNSLPNVESVLPSMQKKLDNKEKIMGFGHRVYVTSDPRNVVIKEWSKKLSDYNANNRAQLSGYALLDSKLESSNDLYAKSEVVEQFMWESKKLFPNLDFYSASTYHFMGIPTAYFTPIFIMSRETGWLGHIFEQRKDNKLIRPNAEYVGIQERKFIALSAR